MRSSVVKGHDFKFLALRRVRKVATCKRAGCTLAKTLKGER